MDTSFAPSLDTSPSPGGDAPDRSASLQAVVDSGAEGSDDVAAPGRAEGAADSDDGTDQSNVEMTPEQELEAYRNFQHASYGEFASNLLQKYIPARDEVWAKALRDPAQRAAILKNLGVSEGTPQPKPAVPAQASTDGLPPAVKAEIEALRKQVQQFGGEFNGFKAKQTAAEVATYKQKNDAEIGEGFKQHVAHLLTPQMKAKYEAVRKHAIELAVNDNARRPLAEYVRAAAVMAGEYKAQNPVQNRSNVTPMRQPAGKSLPQSQARAGETPPERAIRIRNEQLASLQAQMDAE